MWPQDPIQIAAGKEPTDWPTKTSHSKRKCGGEEPPLLTAEGGFYFLLLLLVAPSLRPALWLLGPCKKRQLTAPTAPLCWSKGTEAMPAGPEAGLVWQEPLLKGRPVGTGFLQQTITGSQVTQAQVADLTRTG